MRFLTDQDVYAASVQFLRNLGHDVATAAERGLSRSADSELLLLSHNDGRIFVTRDRDYGALVFVHSMSGGVIYLRILPSTLNAVHAELERVLQIYDESELQSAFIVVEPGRHRIRRAASDS